MFQLTPPKGVVLNYKRNVKMTKRHKMPNRQSQKHFTRHAMRAHPKNMTQNPMRGGIRL